MISYKETNAEVAEAAFKKLLSHRWYLTEETVTFCFFSDNSLVSNKIKVSMALQLLSTTVPDEFRCRIPIFRGTVDEQTQLLDFVGSETWFLLEVLNLEESWLYLTPELWSNSDSYQTGKKFVINVKVVNDAAERAVKLHADSDYATILTNNEEQRQSLLQIVEKHRQDFPKL